MAQITFDVSPATAQRVLAAFDRIWPQDAPHNTTTAKEKIWQVVKSFVIQEEKKALEEQLADPLDVPMDDGV